MGPHAWEKSCLVPHVRLFTLKTRAMHLYRPQCSNRNNVLSYYAKALLKFKCISLKHIAQARTDILWHIIYWGFLLPSPRSLDFRSFWIFFLDINWNFVVSTIGNDGMPSVHLQADCYLALLDRPLFLDAQALGRMAVGFEELDSAVRGWQLRADCSRKWKRRKEGKNYLSQF